MKVPVVRKILEANDRIAEMNKALFREKKVAVINLMSSPGAGKTTLLERTIDALSSKIKLGVIEGDIQTSADAERIAKHGVPVVQINTDGACHLDGNMIRDALTAIDIDPLDLLIVENVGNLVCPAEFSVGEDHKVMILSVAEGDDKPAKYPLMFKESTVLLVNKIDLLPYTDCDVNKIRADAKTINPKLIIFEVSCRTGQGLEDWYAWLTKQVHG
ncbi:MAG: hydrogenase nickel incorporation protein HypB [Deltaproteobacteria bacterium]|nr:hydrogenase nickel incorporation protein HypB [Deltaproteobacteria bacterium]